VLRAAADAGIVVDEGEILPDDLYGADEAFITSSIREVMPVVRADGRPIGAEAPGTITKRLHEGYLRLVKEDTERAG
jgi:branched-subunit amino acid aminotransferase/4-amino-4-deoxychorismate lyase